MEHRLAGSSVSPFIIVSTTSRTAVSIDTLLSRPTVYSKRTKMLLTLLLATVASDTQRSRSTMRKTYDFGSYSNIQ